jgi:predicted phosphodiesterase
MKKELLALKSEEDIQKFAKKAGLKFSSVERMIRSVRTKKTGKVYIALIFPDLHHPLYDEPSWNAIKKFIPYIKPQEEVLLGDAMDMSSIDHWKAEKGNQKFFEGKRLLKEYEGFIKEILEPLEQLAPKAKRVYMGGNHEEWAYQMIDRQPQLEGLLEPEIALKLKERGWEWIPYLIKSQGRMSPGMYKIGKLTLTHGQYTNIYHSAKMTQCYDKSVVYGHTHDIQMFTKVHSEDPEDFHTAQSIGCLCNLSPTFLWGRPSKWVHAFGVLYVQPDGKYNLYVPIIIDGRFTFNGIVFDGNK